MASGVEDEERDFLKGDLSGEKGAAGTSAVDLVFVMVEFLYDCSVRDLEHQDDSFIAEYEKGNHSNGMEYPNDKSKDHPHDEHCANYHTYRLKREYLMSCLEEHKIDEPRIFQAPKCSPSSLNLADLVSEGSREEIQSKQVHQKLQKCKESVGFKSGDNKKNICIGVPFVDDLQKTKLGHEEEKPNRSQKALDEENTSEVRRQSEKYRSILEKLHNEIVKLERKLDAKDEVINNLERKLEEIEKELRETLVDLGRFLVENDRKVTEGELLKESASKRKLRESAFSTLSETAQLPQAAQLPQVAQLPQAAQLPEVAQLSQAAQLPQAAKFPQADEASTSAAAMQTVEVETLVNTEVHPTVPIAQGIPPNDVVERSVQESKGKSVSLTYIPSTSVEKSIYNNYKLLLLVISDMLLSGEVVKFQEWTRDVFHVDLSAYVYDGFLELDRKDIISASDLTKLREFFETLSRIDLVHLIDCFLQGDYAYLQRSVSSRKNNNPSRNTRTAAIAATTSIPNPKRPLAVGLLGGARNPGSSQGDEGEESFAGGRAEVQTSQFKSRSSLGNCRTHIEGAFGTNVHRAGQVVADGVAHDKYDRPSVSRSEAGGRKPSQSSTTQWREPQVDMGSNGNKLSKFAREDSSRNRNPQNSDDDDDSDVEDENWLCNHYKRRCHVKFACCDKYWPCHRCHNNESDCGTKKLKSIHTKFVKCVKCGQEQEFGDGSQYCTQCHTKFASYFCAICKHLTGKDDKPYHCEQCGICRIHKHRSFHCDICGVCLDVQLRDNHKCRAGSAHDECCICLEDAFTGCQILPCSHKVHKECASQMIRNGITRCPICRESFAHKLEKRPSNSPRKHHFDSKMPFQK